MRVLALIFALIGAAGSGFMGLVLLDAVQKKEAELAQAKGEAAKARLNEIEEYKNIKRAIYGMIAGIPLGVVGGFLALSRKGKVAAVLLAAAYVIPPAILAVGVGLDFSDDRIKPILLFPAGFIVAAVLALFVPSPTPYRKPRDRPGISEDDDLRG